MNRYLERISGLAGRTVVIVGAANCLGAGIAKVLAAEGAAVVINYASNKQEDGDRIAAEIKTEGGSAIAIQGDAGNPEDVERMFVETKRAYGRVDILVTNASVYEQVPVNQVSEDGYQRFVWMNLPTMLLATREAMKLFGAEGGSIFNINAVIGHRDPRSSSFYTAVKIVLDSVTETLAKDLGMRKIRFNSIDIVVQLLDQDLNRPTRDDLMNFAENRLVEHLSSDIRFWALRLESGRINTFLRLDRAGGFVEHSRMFGADVALAPPE